MDVFGKGNKITLKDTGSGAVRVSVEGSSFYVLSLVLNHEGKNFANVGFVRDVCWDYIEHVGGKVTFSELKDHLRSVFGESKVHEKVC